jgi:hypothetical protein
MIRLLESMMDKVIAEMMIIEMRSLIPEKPKP